jgi:hypothetical protein
MNAKKQKLCEISDREEANMESGHGELQQQNRDKTEPLQFDIECLPQGENLQLRAEVKTQTEKKWTRAESGKSGKRAAASADQQRNLSLRLLSEPESEPLNL